MGAFPPPVRKAGDTCYISDHTDIGIGLNAKSANADAAKKFLTWVASPEFATIYANALPGFFSLNKAGEDGRPAGAGIRVLAQRSASRRSARPIRSCRAARRTSRTRPGLNRPT
jgi:ABC-type glycerol-3-phosphate transport system substrate-binding protein